MDWKNLEKLENKNWKNLVGLLRPDGRRKPMEWIWTAAAPPLWSLVLEEEMNNWNH